MRPSGVPTYLGAVVAGVGVKVEESIMYAVVPELLKTSTAVSVQIRHVLYSWWPTKGLPLGSKNGAQMVSGWRIARNRSSAMLRNCGIGMRLLN